MTPAAEVDAEAEEDTEQESTTSSDYQMPLLSFTDS